VRVIDKRDVEGLDETKSRNVARKYDANIPGKDLLIYVPDVKYSLQLSVVELRLSVLDIERHD